MEEQNDCLYDYVSIEDDEGYGQELESSLFSRTMPSTSPDGETKNTASDDYLMDESVDYDSPMLKTRKKRFSTESIKRTPTFKHVAIEPSFLPYGEAPIKSNAISMIYFLLKLIETQFSTTQNSIYTHIGCIRMQFDGVAHTNRI